MKKYIELDAEVKPKMECLIGYLELYTKLFTYLRVHRIKVPEELHQVIAEAKDFLENPPSISPEEIVNEMIGYYEAQERRSNDDGDRGAISALQELLEKFKS